MAQDDSSVSFEENYAALLELSESSPDSDYVTALSPYLDTFAKLFDFKPYKQVTRANNEKIFKTLSGRLANVLKDINSPSNETIIRVILTSCRILSRSKISLDVFSNEAFVNMLMDCLKHFTSSHEIQRQCISIIINLCVVDLKGTYRIVFKTKAYNAIIKFLTKDIDKNESLTSTERNSLYLITIQCLFYFTANLDDRERKLSKDMYNNDAFFRWLYELYLSKSKYFHIPKYWEKGLVNNNNNGDNTDSATTSNDNNDNKTADEEFTGDWNEDCSVVIQICRLLFNFTLVEQKVLQYKLDKFEREFQFAVVNRTCDILSLPLSLDPRYYAPPCAEMTVKQYQKQIKRWDKCKNLCDIPGIICVKLNLCNVAMYNGDIIGMNLREKSCLPLSELFDFRAMVTRDGYQNQEALCPLLMFLRNILSFNTKYVQPYMKRYIFRKDAYPDSDDDSSDREEDNGRPDMSSKLDKVPKGGTTLRNHIISLLTTVSFNVKTAVGEFLIQLCDNSPDEMIRLVGFGAGIGHMVNKGVPGFAHMADQGVNLEKMAALKRKRENEAKAKAKGQQDNSNDQNNNKSNDKPDETGKKKKKNKPKANNNDNNPNTTEPLNENDLSKNEVSFYEFLDEQLQKEKKNKENTSNDNNNNNNDNNNNSTQAPTNDANGNDASKPSEPAASAASAPSAPKSDENSNK